MAEEKERIEEGQSQETQKEQELSAEEASQVGSEVSQEAQELQESQELEKGRVVEGKEITGKEDEEEELLDQEGIDSILNEIESSEGGQRFELPDVSTDGSGADGEGELDLRQVELLKDVHVKVRVELGRGSMCLRDILKLKEGSVVELEKLAGDPLDIYVNDRLIAKGEVLVLNENFCIRVTEIYSPKDVLRLKS